jgi:hypothetical protein
MIISDNSLSFSITTFPFNIVFNLQLILVGEVDEDNLVKIKRNNNVK